MIEREISWVNSHSPKPRSRAVGVAGAFVHRQAFAGDRGLVDAGGAGHDLAIDRDPLAGADQDQVVDDDLVQRDHEVLALAPYRDPRGKQLGEGVERLASAGGDGLLQHAAEQQQHGNDSRRGVLVDDQGGRRCDRDWDVGGEVALTDAFDGGPPDIDRADQGRREVVSRALLIAASPADQTTWIQDGRDDQEGHAGESEEDAWSQQELPVATRKAAHSARTGRACGLELLQGRIPNAGAQGSAWLRDRIGVIGNARADVVGVELGLSEQGRHVVIVETVLNLVVPAPDRLDEPPIPKQAELLGDG